MPQIRCPECNGAGCIDIDDEDGNSDAWPCKRCDGTGSIESDEEDELRCIDTGIVDIRASGFAVKPEWLDGILDYSTKKAPD